MTIVLNNLPANVDQALQQKAATEGRSVQEVAAEAVARGLGVTREGDTSAQTKTVDSPNWLDKYIGSWVEDPEFNEALKDFERIDPELWK